jgi:hypothetical protein
MVANRSGFGMGGVVHVSADGHGTHGADEVLNREALITGVDLRALGKRIYRLEADPESANRGEALRAFRDAADTAYIRLVKRLPEMTYAQYILSKIKRMLRFPFQCRRRARASSAFCSSSKIK